jgi:hypothetical protein
MESEGSLLCSQELTTGPYPSQMHPIYNFHQISMRYILISY